MRLFSGCNRQIERDCEGSDVCRNNFPDNELDNKRNEWRLDKLSSWLERG